MDSAEARVYRMSNFGEDKDDCVVLVHHKQARNVINMANSYLDSGRYEPCLLYTSPSPRDS